MAEINRGTGGFWTFLPYGMTVLGAAVGVLYVNFGTQNGNPLVGVVVGTLAGRFMAMGIARLATRFGFRA